VALGQLAPDQGWNVLRSVSQNTNIKLRRVAELIVEWARTDQFPVDVRSRLDQVLRIGCPGSP